MTIIISHISYIIINRGEILSESRPIADAFLEFCASGH